MDAETITFKSNNSALASALTDVDFSGISNKETIAPYFLINGGRTAVVNFGQDSSFAGLKTAQGNQDGNSIGDFYYTPPTGFLALCTKNLPDVAVVPSEHFNTVLYSGNSSTNNITGVGFQPDFVWGKGRNYADHHFLADAVRGSLKWFKTNSTGAESDYSSNADSGIRSFASDGFNLAADGSQIFNNSGKTYVAWNWKANGSGSSNTDGSITSTVSANTDAGFSIVKWSGNETNGATVGHSLTTAPNVIITKCRTSASSWIYGIGGMSGFGVNDYFDMQTTGAKSSTTTFYQGYSANTFQVGVSGAAEMNRSGEDYISYCFHSVDGYSKVGLYTGNGSQDGPFVYTGFRPAFVIRKQTSNTGLWIIQDNARDSYNAATKVLSAESSTAEESPYHLVDMCSNGFKVRSTQDDTNGNGETFIYIAFAETPFKYTNAR